MLKNNNIRRLITIGALIALWGYFTILYIFNYNLSLSVISYPHSKDNINDFGTQRLFMGEKITGEFRAEENYLGIVNISFSTFEQVAYSEEDVLLFRLREKGKSEWYYENTYRSGLVFDVPFLPFGFPIITDSEGKTYEFELESLSGNKKNAIALNFWEPVLLTRYQIPKDELTEDSVTLVKFFIRKISVALGSRDVLFFSFVYFLPLLFYSVLLIPSVKRQLFQVVKDEVNKIYDKAKDVSLFGSDIYPARIVKDVLINKPHSILIFVVLVNIFIIPSLNDLAIVVIGFLWFYLISKHSLSFRPSFDFGVKLLFVTIVLLVFQHPQVAEKAAVWAYVFFIAGTVQIFLEIRKSE